MEFPLTVASKIYLEINLTKRVKMATIKTLKHWRGNLMGRPLRLWEGGVNVIEKTVLSSDIHVLLQSS